MSSVNLNNCRIEFNFYGDALADQVDENLLGNALSEAADALLDAGGGEEGEEADSAAEATAPEDDGENGETPPKIGVARIFESVRRAAASASP